MVARTCFVLEIGKLNGVAELDDDTMIENWILWDEFHQELVGESDGGGRRVPQCENWLVECDAKKWSDLTAWGTKRSDLVHNFAWLYLQGWKMWNKQCINCRRSLCDVCLKKFKRHEEVIGLMQELFMMHEDGFKSKHLTPVTFILIIICCSVQFNLFWILTYQSSLFLLRQKFYWDRRM